MLVTAFICYESGISKGNVDEYLQRFDELARTGLPIILFLDKSLEGRVFYQNVHIVYLTIQDLWTYKYVKSHPIPADVSTSSYHVDYFLITNAKTEFMMRAMNMVNSERLTWIDFGISHVLKGDLSGLRKLARIHELGCGLVLPGWEPEPITDFSSHVWRFLGGFFTGHRHDLINFHKFQCEAFVRLHPKIPLEVITWAWAETHLGFRPRWYRAGFSPAIFDFDQLFT